MPGRFLEGAFLWLEGFFRGPDFCLLVTLCCGSVLLLYGLVFLICRRGYCEKGWAMRSTTCIRHMECRMIEDNLQTLQEYKPMEECFVADGCAFPSDGGWYWRQYRNSSSFREISK